ncbi:hypothetical protein L0666_04255 [Octadecabacter sp. CECT 8868]|uniref:hypothetical protein n=1 Tax=Octadecabacter algicola TaxID=2909342 RepID=UPI001F1CBD27|nr:hypothetical protein [Octadecabacter algicola]MCF2904190.1 hypothetical protein [Octadecabacter algicola]
MADYDFSKPAPDRTHRVPIKEGSGMGGLGFMLVGAVILLSVLYAVFGGSAAPIPVADEPVPTVPSE